MLYQVYLLLFQDKVAQFMLLKTTHLAYTGTGVG